MKNEALSLYIKTGYLDLNNTQFKIMIA